MESEKQKIEKAIWNFIDELQNSFPDTEIDTDKLSFKLWDVIPEELNNFI